MPTHAGRIVIESPRLRHWRDGDLAPFAALNADPRVMRHDPAVRDRGESDAMAGRIRGRRHGGARKPALARGGAPPRHDAGRTRHVAGAPHPRTERS